MNLFTGLGTMVTTVGSALVSAFDSVTSIFYVVADNEITLVGYLLIAALAVGLIKLALNLIVRLFTRVK